MRVEKDLKLINKRKLMEKPSDSWPRENVAVINFVFRTEDGRISGQAAVQTAKGTAMEMEKNAEAELRMLFEDQIEVALLKPQEAIYA